MLEPIYRIEFFLDAIVNNTTPPEPIYRVEFYLAKIAGADVEIPEPVYRMEKYLAYLCGEEVELPDPIYRIEYYLAFLCGLNVELPEPIYRVEFWLWDWCGGGGIEKTVTGNPIHILDALAKPAQALSVKLEPIQDLHGYDNPWPAGGGKNLLDPDAKATTSFNIYFYKDTGLLLKANKSYTLTAYSSQNASGVYINSYPDNAKLVIKYNAKTVTYTPTEDVMAWFDVYYATAPTEGTANINVQLELGNVSTAWTPFSNLCPISGHTDADVTRTGKNLANVTPTLDSNRYVTFFGNHSASDATTGIFLKAGTYTLSVANPQGANVGVYGCYLDDHAQITISGNGTQTTKTGTLTLSKDRTLNFWLYFDTVGTNYTEGITVQLELGSTATAYEEYRGTTYPIPLGTTVYGGTLDVLTGVLTVTMAMVDLGSLNYNPYTYAGVFGGIAIVTPAPKPFPASEVANAKCSALKVVSDNVFNLDGLKAEVVINAIGSVKVKGVNATTAAELKAELSGVMLCYELATPQTIQLTPTQVELLLGENNIWSDGEMTLVYLADGNASDAEALNILLGGRYVNNHGEDEPTDREALNIILGGNER